MVLKTVIYLISLFIVVAGVGIGYQAGFVAPETVPFAQELFFSIDHGRLEMITPFMCFIFYVSLANGVSILSMATLGKLLGYKIEVVGIFGGAMGISLGSKKESFTR